MYTASLRFLFMIPFLAIIVAKRGKFGALIREMKRKPGAWMLWSFVGFGVMYVPVCFAAEYEPGWLIAGTWQVTVVAGALLAPLLRQKIQTADGTVTVRGSIHWKGLGLSSMIVAGAMIMQFSHAEGLSGKDLLLGALPVLVAAFAYPLGNRKMIEVCEGKLDAYQRVLGMALASLPLWLVLSFVAYLQDGLPSAGQTGQALLVAVCSGVIATVLFFAATEMAKGSAEKLAAVEATQAGEVVFATAGELLLLPIALPAPLAWVGMVLVILGMTLHSMFFKTTPAAKGAKPVTASGAAKTDRSHRP